jgi:hypothetical protein
MEQTSAGDRVRVAAGNGPSIDGIVFSFPSKAKVSVAIVDPQRGPVFATFHRDQLTERTEDGAQDTALKLLIRRTPPPGRGAAGAGPGAAHGRSGHARAAGHRTTGK